MNCIIIFQINYMRFYFVFFSFSLVAKRELLFMLLEQYVAGLNEGNTSYSDISVCCLLQKKGSSLD